MRDKVSVLAANEAPDLIGMLAIGAHGALIGISQVAPLLWSGFLAESLAGDFNVAPRMFQDQLLPIISHIFEDMQPTSPVGVATLTKETLRQLGVFRSSHVRRPDLDITPRNNKTGSGRPHQSKPY